MASPHGASQRIQKTFRTRMKRSALLLPQRVQVRVLSVGSLRPKQAATASIILFQNSRTKSTTCAALFENQWYMPPQKIVVVKKASLTMNDCIRRQQRVASRNSAAILCYPDIFLQNNVQCLNKHTHNKDCASEMQSSSRKVHGDQSPNYKYFLKFF